MGAVTTTYRASSNLTVTALHSLASSSTFLSGWTSGTIDNTTNLDLDIAVTAKFTIASANNQAGEIRVYAYAMLDDSNWPDLFSAGTEGTEGTATIHDTEQASSAFVLLWSTSVDTGTAEVHSMPPASLRGAFGGLVPPKCALFIAATAATSTNASFASSGNQVTTKGYGESVA